MSDPNRGRGDQHLDDRRPLAYVYDGTVLLAVLYDRRGVAFVREGDLESRGYTVSLTPHGEEVLEESNGDTE